MKKKHLLILLLFAFIQSFLVIIYMYIKPYTLNALSKAERALIYVLISTLILAVEFYLIEKETEQKLKFWESIVIGSLTACFSFTFAHLFWFVLGFLDKSLINFSKQVIAFFLGGIVFSIIAYIIVRIKSRLEKQHCA